MTRPHPPYVSALARAPLRRVCDEQASTTVEYVGLTAVVAMMMSGIMSVIDSATGARMAQAMIERLLNAISA